MVDVATGYGIIVVVAAQTGGSVISYDADPNRVQIARETARLSFVSDKVDN